MLSTSDGRLWCTFIVAVIVFAVFLSILFVNTSGFVRSWIARRARHVVQDLDEDGISIQDPVPVRYAQPESSGKPQYSSLVRNVET